MTKKSGGYLLRQLQEEGEEEEEAIGRQTVAHPNRDLKKNKKKRATCVILQLVFMFLNN